MIRHATAHDADLGPDADFSPLAETGAALRLGAGRPG